MRIPGLGPRGEGWAIAQLALAVVIVVAGIAGPRWSATAASLRLVAGIAIGFAGWALLVAGVVGLGNSLTPFPRPSDRSTLRMSGAYRLVRHPIYGGSMLVALGWSLLSSPFALLAAAFLAILFELKSRHEESMLVVRFPEYDAYRRRVRWRFLPGVH
jgi:protein-S-isoprenylcysteine O-methyltransferase Ste14